MLGSSESSLRPVETRPEHLDAWLNNLPYLNFERCVTLLEGALRQTNALRIKPQTRLELLEHYSRPYRYLLDTELRAVVAKGNKRQEQALKDIQTLRRVATELAIGCKQVIHDPMFRKSRWRQNNLIAPATYLAVKRQAHLLLLSFQDYSPTPKNAWLDMYDFVKQAEAADQLNAAVADTENDPPTTSSVARELKHIILTSLLDPHHEPYGAVWDVYELTERWAEAAELLPFKRRAETAGWFVIDLGSDEQPTPLERFTGESSDRLRLLNCNPALNALGQEIKHLESRQDPATNNRRQLYRRLWQAWSRPTQRNGPRKPQSGYVEVAQGLHAAFYHMNQGRDLETNANLAPDSSGIWVDGEHDAIESQAKRYPLKEWAVSNTSPGGVAIYSTENATAHVPVGEIVAIRVRGDDGPFRLGIVRWLVIQQQAARKLGVEWLPAARPVTFHGTDHAATAHQARRALYVKALQGPATLVTGPGLHGSNRELLLEMDSQSVAVEVGRLLESSQRFERFEIS
jgi:hypothetical protein